ncbi:MAG: cation transporter [Clostridia bacterium]|nr:cation transporter [Clostridia bacterium]
MPYNTGYTCINDGKGGLSVQRDQIIVRTSVIGILANVFLAAFKAVVGVVSGSIAITLDAVNNLSDALSSVITIIGAKLAGRKPDKKHPYGYGRIEYISAVLISVIVLYAGVTSLVESVKKIIHPEQPEYTPVGLAIIAVAVVVKILLGRYVKGVGEKVNSDSLIASGKDAMLDSVISASTLVAAGIYLATRVSLEAWLGAVISVVIIKSGIGMLSDSLSDILGERAESGLSKGIKQAICAFDEVHGAYDLLLHSYGPDRLLGSVHIEVPDTMTVDRLDRLERDIAQKVYSEFGVILTGVSVYSMNTRDDAAARLQQDIRRTVMAHDHVLQMHGFYLDEATKTIRFDVIIDFAAPDRVGEYRRIVEALERQYPGYTFAVALDVDASD